VKPGNILFDAFGRAYLGDFGIVKAIASEDGAVTTGLTGAGHVIGTAPYMAPEMLQGEKFDHRVDQYALGVVVYQLLSGVLPYEGTTPAAVAVQQVTKDIKPLREVNPLLSVRACNMVHDCLSRLPGKRHPTCRAFMLGLLEQQLPKATETAEVRGNDDHEFSGSCPGCGKRVRMKSARVGRTVRCPSCRHEWKAQVSLLDTKAKPALLRPNDPGLTLNMGPPVEQKLTDWERVAFAIACAVFAIGILIL
jgi:serine/threonine protein kinase